MSVLAGRVRRLLTRHIYPLRALQRELALEKAQGEVWKALLEANGLF